MSTSSRRAAAWLMALGVLLPFLPLIGWAAARRWPYPDLLPEEYSVRGVALVADPSSGVVPALLTSLGIGAAVTVLALAVGIPAGRALGQYEFRGRRIAQFLLLAPALVPALAVFLGMHVVLLRLGLADSMAGVVLAHLVPTVPYVTFVLAGAFAAYDAGYDESAAMLGAGRLRVLTTVTLPVLRPSLTAAALFAFLISWSEYVLTLLVGGGVVQTLPLLLFSYARGADLQEAAAVALLLALPPLVGVIALARGLLSVPAGPLPAGRS